MPEEGSQTTQTGDTAPKQDAAPAGVTLEQVKSLTSEAVSSALAENQAKTEKAIKEANEKAEAAQSRLAAASTALSGAPPQDANKQFLEQFLRNPAGTLSEAMRMAKEEAVEEVYTETATEKAFDNAVAGEYARRRDSGLDVTPEDKAAHAAYYSLTDPGLPAEERFKQAVKKHDDYLEKVGLGSFEERVKSAASMPSKSASAPGGRQESTFDEEGELKKEMAASLSHYNRAFNIDDD